MASNSVLNQDSSAKVSLSVIATISPRASEMPKFRAAAGPLGSCLAYLTFKLACLNSSATDRTSSSEPSSHTINSNCSRGNSWRESASRQRRRSFMRLRVGTITDTSMQLIFRHLRTIFAPLFDNRSCQQKQFDLHLDQPHDARQAELFRIRLQFGSESNCVPIQIICERSSRIGRGIDKLAAVATIIPFTFHRAIGLPTSPSIVVDPAPCRESDLKPMTIRPSA